MISLHTTVSIPIPEENDVVELLQIALELGDAVSKRINFVDYESEDDNEADDVRGGQMQMAPGSTPSPALLTPSPTPVKPRLLGKKRPPPRNQSQSLSNKRQKTNEVVTAIGWTRKDEQDVVDLICYEDSPHDGDVGSRRSGGW